MKELCHFCIGCSPVSAGPDGPNLGVTPGQSDPGFDYGPASPISVVSVSDGCSDLVWTRSRMV